MTVILVRHGRSTANTSGILAGQSRGVSLDSTGEFQAQELVDRLSGLALTAIVRSPLERCAQTIAPLLAATGVVEQIEPDLIEVDYGSWTGQSLSQLVSEPLWKTVQRNPSHAQFPEGESLAAVQRRAVAAIRRLDQQFSGPDGKGLWVACSHGDVIKSVIADAYATHLDNFQRIIVEPASISVIQYHASRPYVYTVNCTGRLPNIPIRKVGYETEGGVPDAAVIGGSAGIS